MHGPEVSDGKLRPQGTESLAGNGLGGRSLRLGEKRADTSTPPQADGDTEAEGQMMCSGERLGRA